MSDAVFEWRESDVSFPGFPVLDLYHRDARVGWINKRPPYCDRGHWEFGTELGGIDEFDSFPRYYMDLDAAKREAERWTFWRLYKKEMDADAKT